MRLGEPHAVLGGVVLEGQGGIGLRQLHVISAHRKIARAQVLREDAPHLAVADEADAPAQRFSRHSAVPHE